MFRCCVKVLTSRATRRISSTATLPNDRQSTREWLDAQLRGAVERLRHAGVETAQLDAQLLLAHAAGVERHELLLRASTRCADDADVDDRRLRATLVERRVGETFAASVARRCRREPLAYVTGSKQFYGRAFDVDANVLIPRPDTETLVEALVERLDAVAAARDLALLDVGTGSGCILVSALLASRHAAAAVAGADGDADASSSVRAIGCDVSPAALDVARRNALKHGLAAPTTAFVHSDWLDAVPCTGRRALVVACNAPYVPRSATLAAELAFEPPLALFGSLDATYAPLLRSLDAYVRRCAPLRVELLLEIGAGMHDELTALATRSFGWRLCAQRRDLAGTVRVLHFDA